MFGKIPANAVKILYNNVIYNSLAEASRQLNMSIYKIMKNGGVKYNA